MVGAVGNGAAGSGRPIKALERQELLGLDVEVLVVLGQRLDEIVDVHEGDRDAGALGKMRVFW